MPEIKRMAGEATRIAQEAQEQAKIVSQEYQSGVESTYASSLGRTSVPARC